MAIIRTESTLLHDQLTDLIKQHGNLTIGLCANEKYLFIDINDNGKMKQCGNIIDNQVR